MCHKSSIFLAPLRGGSAPTGHRSPSGASATSPVSGESVSQWEVFETLKRLLHKEKIQVQQPLYG